MVAEPDRTLPPPSVVTARRRKGCECQPGSVKHGTVFSDNARNARNALRARVVLVRWYGPQAPRLPRPPQA